MTIGQAYQHAAQALQTQLNLDRAEVRSRARLLVDQVANQSHAHLLSPDSFFDKNQISRFQTSLNQALQGRPLPYILGRWEFYGLPFEVDESVLIPRPETELLVDAALQRLQSTLAPRVADLGTGSGCIAVSVAHARADCEVWATDISPDALALARQNAVRHGVRKRLHFLQSEGTNWVAPLVAPSKYFDAVLSNPPYIATPKIADLQVEVRDWEPRRALDGGADGLDAYRDLAAQIKPILKPDGFFACELGAGQFDGVRDIFEAGYWQVEAPIFDLAGIARVLVAHPVEIGHQSTLKPSSP